MGIFFTLFYQPVANILFFFINVFNSYLFIGIFFTILFFKFILLKINISSIKVQDKIKSIQGELEKIRNNKKLSKEDQAHKTLALYREYKINPFSPILFLLLQIPIFLSLFFLLRDLSKGSFLETSLYSFNTFNLSTINEYLFSFNLYEQGGFIFAVLALISQLILLKVSVKDDGSQPPFLKRVMHILIIVIGVISFFIAKAIVLFWIINNLISIVLEITLLKRYKK